MHHRFGFSLGRSKCTKALNCLENLSKETDFYVLSTFFLFSFGFTDECDEDIWRSV